MADPTIPLSAPRLPCLPNAEDALAAAVWRKVTLRLIPLLFVLYLVNILDRINVGFAKLTMLKDLGLNDKHYGFFAGLFYIGYVLFEVPSNLILNRVGARTWIARILISWGIVSGAMMFIQGWWSFSALRLLLGVAEAGFFPGIILYLTYWFPARARGRAVAFFMIASPAAGMVGGPLSGAIMQYMDGTGGLAGWQWLFLLEALPSVILGFVVWFHLTDRPEQAHWLSTEERGWLVARMSREDKRRPERHLLQALTLPGVWLLVLVYFSAAVGTNGMGGFFLPTFIKELFPGRKEAAIGLLSAIPSLAGIIGMIVFGLSSDRSKERRWHIATAAFVGALGMIVSVTIPPTEPELALAAMALAYFGMFGMLPTFWALATHNLTGVAAAGAIALINSVANLGGFLAPTAVGWIKEETGRFTGGAWFLGVTLCLGGLIVLLVHHDRKLEEM